MTDHFAESAARKWRHRRGDRYILVVSEIVGNTDRGFTTERYSTDITFGSLRQAWVAGLRELDRSDDFNLGVLRRGRLVATLWNDEIVDDDPDTVAAIARQLGLPRFDGMVTP